MGPVGPTVRYIFLKLKKIVKLLYSTSSFFFFLYRVPLAPVVNEAVKDPLALLVFVVLMVWLDLPALL